GTGNTVKNRAVDIRGSIQGACGGKGNWTGKTAPLSGAAKGTGYGASAGEEGSWPRTVTEGNRETGDGQGAVGGRRRAQAGLGARAGSGAPRLSSETRSRTWPGVALIAWPQQPRGRL